MAFVVVEYNEECGGGVSLVNSKWLTPRKQEVWWPPYKHQHLFDKALRNGDTPDESWQLYGLTRTFYESDDYIKAREKLELSRVQSDLQSEADDEDFTRKRRSRPRKLLYDSDESDDDITKPKSKKKTLSRPPRVNISQFTEKLNNQKSIDVDQSNSATVGKIQNCNSLLNNSYIQEVTERANSSHCSSFLDDSGIQTKLTPNTSSRFSTTQVASTPVLTHTSSPHIRENTPTRNSQVNNFSQNLLDITCDAEEEFPITTSNSSPSLNSGISVSSSNADVTKKLLAAVIFVKQQNEQILKLLDSMQKPSVVHSFELPENIPVSLPLENFVGVNELELYLNDKKNLQAFVLYLSTIGGREVVSKTNSILKRLLTNQLASKYSFLGTRNGKRPFSHLILRTAILRAVQTVSPTSLEKDVDDCIKTWLKHSPQRAAKQRDESR